MNFSELNNKFGHYFQKQEPYKKELMNENCEMKKLVIQLISKNEK